MLKKVTRKKTVMGKTLAQVFAPPAPMPQDGTFFHLMLTWRDGQFQVEEQDMGDLATILKAVAGPYADLYYEPTPLTPTIALAWDNEAKAWRFQVTDPPQKTARAQRPREKP